VSFVLRVEPDYDVPGERVARFVQETGILHGRGADDDEGDAVVEVALDGLQVADASAQLHGDVRVDRGDDVLDGRFVPRLAGDGAVQVDDVQALGALAGPLRRGLAGFLREHRGRFHAPLLEAHAVAVFQVDRGDDQHGGSEPLGIPGGEIAE
jgi:hypothetical protein